MATSREEQTHFSELQNTWDELSLIKAKRKASPPSQLMRWLGLDFDTIMMTITIPPAKLTEIVDIITEWQGLSHATLHTL